MAHVSSLYFNPTTSVTDFQGKAERIANSGVIKVTALFALELIPANQKGYFLQAKNMKRGKFFMGRSVKKKKKKKKKWRRDLSLSDWRRDDVNKWIF